MLESFVSSDPLGRAVSQKPEAGHSGFVRRANGTAATDILMSKCALL